MSENKEENTIQKEEEHPKQEEEHKEETEETKGEAGETKHLTASQKKRLKKKEKKAAAAAAAGKEHEGASSSSSSSSSSEASGNGSESQDDKKKDGALPLLDYPKRVGQACPQTLPPTVPLDVMYPKLHFPTGKMGKYKDDETTHRSSDPEKIGIDIRNEPITNDFRKAAEAHRQARAYARATLKPGVELYDFCTNLEMKVRMMLDGKEPAIIDEHHASSSSVSEIEHHKKDKKHQSDEIPYSYHTFDFSHAKAGLAFPTGVSINSCAAHYTPNPGDHRKVEIGDVVKVDIGTHVNGHIIDSAFTMSFNPDMDPLVQATKEATWAGLKMAGIDARLCELGEVIEETITSFEVTIDGKTRKLRPVSNLGGHGLGDYLVHAGSMIPLIKNGCEPTLKMAEGEVYAIETFASTGKGKVSDTSDTSHYMMDPDAMHHINVLHSPTARHLLSHINKKFGTLAWCRRWLDQTGEKKHSLELKSLVDAGLVEPYPPLVDQPGCYISQHEHTILIKSTGKEVVSYGEDDGDITF